MSGGSRTFYPVASLPDTNSRQPTMQIRPPSSSLLCIDSEDRNQSYTVSRDATSSPYSFSITKTESIMNGFFTRLGVTEVVFPWVIPNINPKTSSIIVNVTVGGGGIVSRTLTLNPAFLKPSEIATAMQVGIRTLFSDTVSMLGFTMIYGSIATVGINATNVPVFSYASNAVGTLVSFSPVPYNTASYPYPTNTKQLFDVLGFSTGSNTTLSASAFGGATMCNPIRYVDIVSSQLTTNQSLKDAMSQQVVRDTLCRIYISSEANQSTTSPTDAAFCPPGCAPTTIFRQFASPKLIQWLPDQPIPGYLRFEVLDDAGAPLYESDPFAASTSTGSFPAQINRTDWSMTLQVTEN